LKKTQTILYLGFSGFPFGSAATQRQLQISKILHHTGKRVLVINREGFHTSETIHRENIRRSGVFEGIDYIYVSGTPLYPTNYFIRNTLKIVGWIGEWLCILYTYLFKGMRCVVVNTGILSELKYYYKITRFLRVRLIYDYVEYMSSIEDRTMKESSNHDSFDYQFFRYTDALIIISHFLEVHVKKLAPHMPYILIPPIIDFAKFEKANSTPPHSNYFLYCSTIQYKDVIEFIIQAYLASKGPERGVSLVLIISGRPDKIKELRSYIEMHKANVSLLSDLTYETLIGYYKSARALLIPIPNNLQDQARFPFKICEYTAAARPIISSDSGALIHFFQDRKNALLAKTEDSSDFTEKLNFVLHHPEEAELIAVEGYKTGLQHFNYLSYTRVLEDLVTA
jgi:glycosyltransferase involved in cell wall biosynthesis